MKLFKYVLVENIERHTEKQCNVLQLCSNVCTVQESRCCMFAGKSDLWCMLMTLKLLFKNPLEARR